MVTNDSKSSFTPTHTPQYPLSQKAIYREEREMILAEAVELVKYHQNMMSQVDEYTEEYIADLLDPHSKGNGVAFSKALEIVLKGANTDGQSKDYPKAS